MESNGRDTILISCFKYQKVVVYIYDEWFNIALKSC